MKATLQLRAHWGSSDHEHPVAEHDHPHPHAEGHHHSHETGPGSPADGHLHQHGQLGHGAPVLNIGGDIGALLLYTTSELEGLEIEVSTLAEPDHRTHTEVLRRTVGGQTFWAAVYAELPAGEYQIWYDDPAGERHFTVRGGEVAELDWR